MSDVLFARALEGKKVMAPEVLAGLILFNGYVAELRPLIVPNERVFVGTQPGLRSHGLAGPVPGDAWTGCVPGSGVFVIHIMENATTYSKEILRVIAAHELCHVHRHAQYLCDGKAYSALSVREKMNVEQEADNCAAEFLGSVDEIPIEEKP